MANNYVRMTMEETPRYEGAPSIAPYRVSTSPVYFPVTAGKINAVPSHIDRGQELRNVYGDPPLIVETYSPDGSLSERAYINHLVWLLTLAGFKGVATPGDGVNATWTLTWGGTAATGGTWTLSFGGQTTAGIPYNATAAQAQAIIEQLSTIGVGNVLVTQTSGGPPPTVPGVWTLTFRRAQGGKVIAAVTTSIAGLTGGAPTIAAATGVAGVAPTVTNPDFATGDLFSTTPQEFVGVGATKWVFSKRTGAQAQTAEMTMSYGDMGVWLRGQGYGVSQMSMDAAGALNASLMGLVVASIADPGFSPTYDSQSILPAKRGDLFLTWLSGGGVVDDFNFQIDNPLVQVRSLSLATPSLFPDVMENGDNDVKITGSIPKRRFNATDYAAVLAGTTFAAKARWLTPTYVADSPSRYGLWIEMPSCQMDAATPDDLYSRRRAGASYNFWGAFDETAGFDVRVTITSGVPAATLSTPFSV